MDFHSFTTGEHLPPLADWYPWPAGRSWLRCIMLTTLDGAVRGEDGVSGSLSCAADQYVFAQVRRYAHAVLVGAETLRAEGYEPLAEGAESRDRILRGLTPAPVLVVVTSSMDLPWDAPVFRDAALRPLIVTTQSAPGSAVARARRHCEVIALPGDRVDPIQLVSAIAFSGRTHILCEGGPDLLAQLSRAGLVDEADITIAPMQASGGQTVTGGAMSAAPHLTLKALIEQDSWLFARYVRQTDLERTP